MRAGCSKAQPKNFAPPQTRFPGAQDGQNLISWRWSQPSPTDSVIFVNENENYQKRKNNDSVNEN